MLSGLILVGVEPNWQQIVVATLRNCRRSTRIRQDSKRAMSWEVVAKDRRRLYAVEAISKRYGSVVALENVDFSVDTGEVVGLVGDNAAGK